MARAAMSGDGGTTRTTSRWSNNQRRTSMARGLLLWLIGIPIPVIILLWLFFS